MSRLAYRRPVHRVVQAILRNIDGAALSSGACLFGGGTQLALELDEYRESKDIDFMCAEQRGYRTVRELIADEGIRALFKAPVTLARDVRMDQYGIRCILDLADTKVKFEIGREARIKLTASRRPRDGVVTLSRESAFAEKFLANADRGQDRSTLARDVIDLAHMAAAWGMEEARAGLLIARSAYGKDILEKLDVAVLALQQNKAWRRQCMQALSMETPKVLQAGLEALRATRWRKA